MGTEVVHKSGPIERVLEILHVGAAFGTPMREGEVTVIPVAEIWFSLGYGRQIGRAALQPLIVRVQEINLAGSGHVSARGSVPETAEEAAEDAGPGEGKAMGVGAGGRVSPRGYIQVTPDGATFKEIIDINRLGLAGTAMVAWSVFWIGRTIRALAKRSRTRRR